MPVTIQKWLHLLKHVFKQWCFKQILNLIIDLLVSLPCVLASLKSFLAGWNRYVAREVAFASSINDNRDMCRIIYFWSTSYFLFFFLNFKITTCDLMCNVVWWHDFGSSFFSYLLSEHWNYIPCMLKESTFLCSVLWKCLKIPVTVIRPVAGLSSIMRYLISN